MLQTASTSPAREREGQKKKNDCSEMCEAPESKKRKKSGRALPRVVESKEKRERWRASVYKENTRTY